MANDPTPDLLATVPLTNYRAVPSGMSFDLDTSPAPLAYVLSTPGNAATVGLTGTGTWAVDVLASMDGVNFVVIATLTTPGQWQYNTKGAQAAALRVRSFTSGSISGMLAYGALTPTTNVSPLFGSYLVFLFNSPVTEPPDTNEMRFNSASLPAVTKVWIGNIGALDSDDQFYALRHIPAGGTLLVQDLPDHTNAALFNIVGPIVDKGAYVEVPVTYRQSTGTLTYDWVICAVFNPGAAMTLVTP